MRILLCLLLSLQLLPAAETLPAGVSVAELQVMPREIALKRPTEYAQLVVTAKLSTGVTADVTRMVVPSGVEAFLNVSPTGMVRAKADGAGELVLTLGDKSVKVPATVAGFSAPFTVDYVRDCMPVLSKAGCNAGTCHGSKEGKAGFKLSLRGYDPIYDVRAFTDDAKGRRTNVASPDDSLMLLKATGAVPHEGNQVMTPDSDYYKIIRAWIADTKDVAYRDVNPRIAIVATRFDQQHAFTRICAEAVCQQTARRAGATDDVVISLIDHAAWILAPPHS